MNPDAIGDDLGDRSAGREDADDVRVRPDRETTAVVGAQVVDIVLQFVQLVAVGFALATRFRPESEDALRGLVYLGALTLPLYGGLLEGYWNGQTVGKALVGVKVVDRDGSPPSVGQALFRNVPAVRPTGSTKSAPYPGAVVAGEENIIVVSYMRMEAVYHLFSHHY